MVGDRTSGTSSARSSGPAIDAVLADVARVGPYFAVGTDPDVEGHPLWRPLSELYGTALGEQVRTVQVRLGTGEPRVAASILFQGVAGRVCSPILAAAVLHGTVPALDPGRTYWRAASPGPVVLAAPGTAGLPADPATVRRLLAERHLRPLLRAVQAVTPVAEGLLWGNAASALVGACTVLARARPDRRAAAAGLVERLFTEPPLRGTGDFGPHGFRRRSCCLFYRVPGGGMCGDCALV